MQYRDAVKMLVDSEDATWLDALLVAAEFDKAVETVLLDVDNVRFHNGQGVTKEV